MNTQQMERYLAGDLDAATLKAIDERLALDAELRGRVEARRQAKAEFLLDPRRRRFADLAAEAQRPEPGGNRGRILVWTGLLGAAAALAFLMGRPDPIVPPPTGGYAVKGGVSVELAVQSQGRVQPYISGAPMRVGDRVRISVDDPHGGYVTVLLEDERATDVLYHPNETGHLAPGRHLLPGSLELDQITGRERIYVLISPQPPSPEDWQAQIEAARHAGGFDHGWLPRAPTRLTTIDYQKTAR